MRQEGALQKLQGHQMTHVLLERNYFMSGQYKQANKTMNDRQDKPASYKQEFGISKGCYHFRRGRLSGRKGQHPHTYFRRGRLSSGNTLVGNTTTFVEVDSVAERGSIHIFGKLSKLQIGYLIRCQTVILEVLGL